MKLMQGVRHDLVRELQAKLVEEGFDPGPSDGWFGPRTRKAVVLFQERAGIDADGVVGEKTIEALGFKWKIAKPEKERQLFRALLMENPNYFGTLKVSKFKAVKAFKNKTSYEELMCVGYNPHLSQLEGVVHIKRDYGYSGGLCSNGSQEYVRFFVDWNNDGNWDDVGMASFTVWDVPGDKALEYSATVVIDPKKWFCFHPYLPKVRAILSWDDPVTDDPDFVPVWGNVLEARIQIQPMTHLVVGKLFEAANVTLEEDLASQIDLSQEIAVTEPEELGIVELAKLYKETPVPAQRFGFAYVDAVVNKMASVASTEATLTGPFEELEISFSEVLKAYLKTDGDTSYEELKCVGYNPELRHLTGTLTIKRPCGYLGNLCKKGSNEYVAFWKYDQIEQMWIYLGTATLNVHDIASIPKEGLQYSVSLPVDLSDHRRPCSWGSVEIRIRAIMSWQKPPPPSKPYWVPKWGNREETRIQVKPGPKKSDKQTPYIETVGNMAVCQVNQATGLATGEGLLAYFHADRSPFGGVVTITGYIDNPPKWVMESFQPPLKYRIRRRPHNPASPQPWETVDNQFNVWVREQVGLNPPLQKKILQKVDPADGFYTYLEDPGPPKQRRYLIPVLAKWHTGSRTGVWELAIEAKWGAGPVIPGGTTACEDGTTRTTVLLRLDNERPDAVVDLTGVQVGGTGPILPAQECGEYVKGDILHGTYEVTDEHFRILRFSVEPTGPAHSTNVSPPVRAFDTVPTTGESSSWTLNTTNMDPCGYLVRLRAWDRTIVNSGRIGWGDSDSFGFCLKPDIPVEE